ncbi:MAG: hypothetical protein HYY84_06500 [Deltaproteobacteria bacterium]|nr:hypothetical protein [Deltaproteobacteria bacterium]
MSRRLAIGVVVFVLGVGAALLAAERPIEQPLPYSHAVHTKEAACVLCHAGAQSQPNAGIPKFSVCQSCHATPPPRLAAPDKARWENAAKAKEPEAWNRLYEVPNHVYFSHRRHVAVGGIDCAACHGDMATSTTPPTQAAVPISMRRCVSCHEREQVTNDCTACHR